MDIDFYSDTFNIVLGFKQKANCDAIRKMLEDKTHRYIVSECNCDADMDKADLLIIDGAFLEERRDAVMGYKEKSLPIFFPVLLVTAHPQTELVTKHLWICIDELVRMPVLKIELFARIEILLRARKSSRDANIRASILKKEVRLKNLLAHMAFGGGFFRISLDENVVTFFGKEGEDDRNISLDDWLFSVPDDYRKQIETYIFSPSESEPFVLSYPHAYSDRWDIVQLIKVGKKGNVLYGMWMDFTKEKRREEELERLLSERNVLIRELQHRARTSLQLVSSIINLEEKSADSPSVIRVLKEINTRIDAILFLYQRVYSEKNMYSPTLGDFVKELVPILLKRLIKKPANISLDISVCDVETTIDKANYVGILIAELLILAIKRGLHKIQDPAMEISVKCMGSHAKFLYHDNHGSMDILQKDYDFSIAILKTIAENSLDGKFDISVTKDTGFCFSAELKL
ncbi:histidine kinase dimerization/phosphoacceptor domain -containing protein [Spirochaetia bacterium 38H-sp]|uniref:histidine kinase n=1 Tax=Rarispira pelagica TaxID=3141764 RepID=A0ABU9U8D4_9SPIR